jgi:hypothetical protein
MLRRRGRAAAAPHFLTAEFSRGSRSDAVAAVAKPATNAVYHVGMDLHGGVMGVFPLGPSDL